MERQRGIITAAMTGRNLSDVSYRMLALENEFNEWTDEDPDATSDPYDVIIDDVTITIKQSL